MRQFTIFVASLAVVGGVAGVTGVAGVAVAAGGPMADAGLDQTVTVDTTVQLDGTGSSHPGGRIASYEWTVRTPDGREFAPDCTDCERSRFTPVLAGRYEVTLTVTGADGTTATDRLFVDVRNAGPTVELAGERTPHPGESSTYRATAESSDADLAEIAWLVEDEVVAVQQLSGTAEESSLSLAFTEAETHRLRVIVSDTDGRTAYDQTFVQPQEGDSDDGSDGGGGGGGSEADGGSGGPPGADPTAPTPDCDDADYRASNPGECRDDEPSDSPTPTDGGPSEASTEETVEITYVTDGYASRVAADSGLKTSAFVNRRTEEVGLDGGENAPWRRSSGEVIYDATVGSVSRLLFGQERKTVTCEVTGGERQRLDTGCGEKITELETEGGTTNAYSAGEAGGHSEYGLENARRVEGDDPTELSEGETAEVTVVIQQEEDGVVDEAVRAADRVRSTASDALGVGEGDGDGGDGTGSGSVLRSGSRQDDGDPARSAPDRNDRGLVAGTGSASWGGPQSSGTDDETTSMDDVPEAGASGVGKGLVP